MVSLITDPMLEDRLKAERKAWGADRHDEVWDGVYIMAPLPNNEHQEIVLGIAAVFQVVIGWPGRGTVLAGVNVSDREEDWEQNDRVPDVAVFLPGTRARNCGTHWCGGPDFTVEVLSPNDRTRDKLPFYSEVGVRELLLIDRDPWALELHQLRNGRLVPVARASLEQPAVLASGRLPLVFRLVPGTARPQIEVTHAESGQRWMV